MVYSSKTKGIVTLDTTAGSDFLIDPVAFAYDFGARMYDARLGRWLSIDPLAAKYPYLSPYHSFANNPILVVDSDGRDNVIYLIIANSNSGDTKIDKKTAEDIANIANQYFIDMGLNTHVVLFDESKQGEFNAANMDINDSYAVIGSDKQTSINKIDKIDQNFSDKLQKGWTDKDNPESSNVNAKGIAIDYSDAINLTKSNTGISKLSENELVAISIVHGAGHNAGVMKKNAGINSGDHLNSGIMGDGNHLEAILRNYGKEGAFKQFIFNKENDDNKSYSEGMKKTFEWNEGSKDNYNSNKYPHAK